MEPITRTRSPQQVLNLFRHRYTAKSFDPNRVVSDEDMRVIVESGRLSPSSMGLEPWHFIIAKAGDLTEELTPHCWGVHPHPSHWVLLLGRNPRAFTNTGSDRDPYVGHLHCDIQGRDPSKVDARYQHVKHLLEEDLQLRGDAAVTGWVDRQVYLAMESMLLSAAMLGVDSTPVEGLKVEAVERILVERGLLDPTQFHFVALITFGYTDRAEHRPKTRRPWDEVVTEIP